jgi:hypothetical protein
MSSPSGNLPNGKIAFGLSIFIFLYKLCVQMHLAREIFPLEPFFNLRFYEVAQNS